MRGLRRLAPLLLLTTALTAHAAATAASGDLIEGHATGTWTATAGSPDNATLHWLERWGVVIAYRIDTEQGTQATCLADQLPRNETRGAGPGCPDVDHTASTIEIRSVQGNGTFTRHADDTAIYAASATAPDTPDQTLGILITGLAAALLLTTAIVTWLFVQERRVSRFLVRRLFEETKGRVPPDWPEGMRKAWIARVFVRGKN